MLRPGFESSPPEVLLAVKKQTLRNLKKKAWKLFSEWIRRKDADEGGTERCYTCEAPKFWRELHAGHAIPGRHNAVLLDPEIVRPQCPICNIWKGGMYHVFATKLIKENGMEWWEKKLNASRLAVKYTRGDFETIIEDYKRKLDELV